MSGRSKEEILAEVRARLAERLEVDLEKVGPDTHLRDELDAGSMDMLVLVMDLEEEHGVKVPDEVLPTLATARQVADWLAEQGL